LNLDDKGNGGLELLFEEINDLHSSIFPNEEGKSLSRADFWVLAGIVAVEVTREYNNEECLEGGGVTCFTPEVAI